jgi:putative cardiolipin synthase
MGHARWLLPALLLAGCAQLPPRVDLPVEASAAPAMAGDIAERVLPREARHPGQSGFRLVSTGTEAYALRAYSAQAASTSLDVQTYIWHSDLTGKLLARHALSAADRGVRVRILVDDLDARAKNDGFAALAAHPNIQVRMYNPMASRKGTLGKIAEFSTGFARLNHRMHNKSWIVDGRIALVGGRNLGDEYFDAHEGTNFVDLDLLMAGPVVREVSESFDRFWNSPSNYPIRQLSPEAVNDAALASLRVKLDALPAELASSRYAQVLREDPAVRELLDGETTLHWTADWQFVSDDPLKASLPMEQRSAVLLALVPEMESAQTEVSLISPYFVPGKSGTRQLIGLDQRGIRVRVLTNSLAATDVAAVHGGYSRYRAELLAGGVEIWELKPAAGEPRDFSLAGSSGSSLHTKALILDRERSFVGSYNLDPRSTSLNCEQGVLVTHAGLAAELAALYAREIRGERAWKVNLVEGELRWSDGLRTEDSEPDARASQRFQAWLMKLLPVESQL